MRYPDRFLAKIRFIKDKEWEKEAFLAALNLQLDTLKHDILREVNKRKWVKIW